MKVNYSFFLAFLFLAACVMPISPKSVDEQVAVTEATLTGVYQTIADLSNSGTITHSEYDSLMKAAGQAEQSLTVAKVAITNGIPQDAISSLKLANTVLLELQKTLQEKAR